MGVPPERARVVMHDVGGNFGTRGGFNAEFAVVTWAAWWLLLLNLFDVLETTAAHYSGMSNVLGRQGKNT